jgi:copper homeostasis protein
MIDDVKFFKENGADGIVFGFLDSDDQIDVENCQRLISAWGRGSITFHRAFDETRKEDLEKNIDILASLGVDRILSSGFEASAEDGIPNLKRMVAYSVNTSITILCGAGITAGNVSKIVSETNCKEIHSSARSKVEASGSKLSMGGEKGDLDPLMVCDPIKVQEILRNMNVHQD